MDAVFLLDCEEQELLKKVQESGSEVSSNVYLKRLSTYKEKTLPVLKYYDDTGKLYIVGLKNLCSRPTIRNNFTLLFHIQQNKCVK